VPLCVLASAQLLGMQSGPVEVLKHGAARVVRQPGDGSCLFHSLSHGLADGSSANKLRREVAEFISANPSLMISDSPLKDWVLWDSGSTVAAYSRKMSMGGVWGGGIEMAAVSHLKHVNVYVYQSSAGGYKRISVRPAAAIRTLTKAWHTHPAPSRRRAVRTLALHARRLSRVLSSPSCLPCAVVCVRPQTFEGTPGPGGGKCRAVRVLYGGGVHYDALEASG
jgi:hypothetical protein